MPEDGALERRLGDADRARAKLVAVVHGVVMQRAAGERLAIELGHVLGVRRGKWVMREHGPARARLGLEQREVDDPTERVGSRRRRSEAADQFLAYLVQHRR